MKRSSSASHVDLIIDRHDGAMTTARRILIPGALIAIPVVFAVGSVALAQMPPSPQLPAAPLSVQLAEPTPPPVVAPPVVTPPAPVPPVATAPAEPVPPAPAPPVPPAPPAGDDDGDDDGGDDDD